MLLCLIDLYQYNSHTMSVSLSIYIFIFYIEIRCVYKVYNRAKLLSKYLRLIKRRLLDENVNLSVIKHTVQFLRPELPSTRKGQRIAE